MARAGVEQGAAFETAVYGRGGALELGLPAAERRGDCWSPRPRRPAPASRSAVPPDRGRSRPSGSTADRSARRGPGRGRTRPWSRCRSPARAAKIVEPAQHWAGRTRREAGGSCAGQGEEQVAEALRLGGLNLIVGDGVERRRGLERRRRDCRRLGGGRWRGRCCRRRRRSRRRRCRRPRRSSGLDLTRGPSSPRLQGYRRKRTGARLNRRGAGVVCGSGVSDAGGVVVCGVASLMPPQQTHSAIASAASA